MENNTEIWKDIPGYEGYQVSNLGRVKSIKNYRGSGDKIMKVSSDGRGYFQLALMKNKKSKTIKVHKLVAITFLNHSQSGMNEVINHKDGNKSNNNVDNLETTTQRNNMNEFFRLNSNNLTSSYKGVHWNKRVGKWETSIKIGGKKRLHGYFESEIDAYNFYSSKLLELGL